MSDDVHTPKEVLGPYYAALGPRELAELMDGAEDVLDDHCISGIIDLYDKAIVLWTGTGRRMEVPLSSVVCDEHCPPDYSDFDIVDGGSSIRIGRLKVPFADVERVTSTP